MISGAGHSGTAPANVAQEAANTMPIRATKASVLTSLEFIVGAFSLFRQIADESILPLNLGNYRPKKREDPAIETVIRYA
jgi:K+ transporter